MLSGLAVAEVAPRARSSGLVDWEELRSSGGLLSVFRTKVPGGWLVYVCNGYHHHGGVTFYADPSHSWNGESLD